MLQHLYQNERTSRLARVLALMVAASFLFAVCAAAADFFMCYEVSVNGEIVGYVESEETYSRAKTAVEDYAKNVLGHEYELPVETSCALRLTVAASATDTSAVMDAMLAEVTEIAEMYVLSVDGVEVAGAYEANVIEDVIASVVEYYTRGDEIGKVTVLSSVEIIRKSVDKSILKTEEELFTLLTKEQPIRVSAKYLRSEIVNVPCTVREVLLDTEYTDYESVTEGQDGISEVYETYTLVNGEEVASEYVTTVVRKEAVDAVILRGTKEIPPTRPTGTYVLPVDSEVGKFTSDFGKRGKYEKHTGVDIAAASNTDIFACDSGKVTFAQRKGNYGLYLIIEHGNGVETRYAHLRKINVKVGDEVVQGQVVAKMGSTGRSTGPHLHFEILKDGKVENPNDYIDMSLYQDYR